MAFILIAIGISKEDLIFEASSKEDFTQKVVARIQAWIKAGKATPYRLKILLDKKERKYSEVAKGNNFIESMSVDPSMMYLTAKEKALTVRMEDMVIANHSTFESEDDVNDYASDLPF